MSSNDDDRLALFGGRPIRPEGPIERVVNRPEIQAALERAYRDGDWHRYHGKNTERLRESLAAFHGVSHVELCCSGTAGLEIALKGLNVKPGDEVLVSGYDFKGIVASVLAVGAVPVVVDVDPTTLAPTVAHYSEATTERTKALIVSHLHGNSAPVDSIVEWAKPRGIAVVEDACQSPGATIAGKRAGTWGDVGVLSFGGSKLLTAGRGGAVLASNFRIAARMRVYCDRGNHAFPMSELQAAVLLPQLESLESDNRRRLEAVKRFVERIDPEWRLIPTHCSRRDVVPVFYKLGLMPTGECWRDASRATVSAAFRAEGAAIDAGFQSVPLMFVKSRFRASGDLNESMSMGLRMLVIHHPVLLAGEDELGLVVRAIRKVAGAIDRGELEPVASS